MSYQGRMLNAGNGTGFRGSQYAIGYRDAQHQCAVIAAEDATHVVWFNK